MKKYCIFKVYDYKGGELSSSTNLSHKQFIGELSEMFEDIDIDSVKEKRDKVIKTVLGLDESDNDITEIKNLLKEKLKDDDFYSTYAGGDGFCGECYVVEDSNLTPIDIEDYLDDIAKHILKNWFK